MDFVEGNNLAEELEQSSLSQAEAADLIATVADALQHTHSRGLVHRELRAEPRCSAPQPVPYRPARVSFRRAFPQVSLQQRELLPPPESPGRERCNRKKQ